MGDTRPCRQVFPRAAPPGGFVLVGSARALFQRQKGVVDLVCGRPVSAATPDMNRVRLAVTYIKSMSRGLGY